MSTIPKKVGKLSREEEEIILNNLEAMDNEAIASLINRNIEVVEKYRAQAPVLVSNYSYVDIIQQLHKKFFWPQVEKQLLDNEEKHYFESYWAALVTQFAPQGIVSTDELLMRDLIMTDVHVNRCLKTKNESLKDLNQIEVDIHQIYADTANDPIRRIAQLDPLQNRANSLRTALKSMGDEWKILQEKKDKKHEQLKATRQSRLEKVEKSGRSFFDLVKMLDAPEVREKEGRLNELYKIAGEIAKTRFTKLHKYEDGKFDQPFLTPESLEENDNENIEKKERQHSN